MSSHAQAKQIRTLGQLQTAVGRDLDGMVVLAGTLNTQPYSQSDIALALGMAIDGACIGACVRWNGWRDGRGRGHSSGGCMT